MLHTELTPLQTARMLIEEKVSLDEYMNVQNARYDRLKTFEKHKVAIMVEKEKELIAYGEEVIKYMKSGGLA